MGMNHAINRAQTHVSVYCTNLNDKLHWSQSQGKPGWTQPGFVCEERKTQARSMRTILLVALSILALANADAASFDCKAAAHTPREQAISSDPKLSSLDEQLAAAYKNAHTELSSAAFALVQSDQREWLRWLDKVCSPDHPPEGDLSGCLTRHYIRRVQLLNKIQLIRGITFYPRAHYVFVAATKAQKNDLDTQYPGFGNGESAWPQIDKPTPEQDAGTAL